MNNPGGCNRPDTYYRLMIVSGQTLSAGAWGGGRKIAVEYNDTVIYPDKVRINLYQ